MCPNNFTLHVSTTLKFSKKPKNEMDEKRKGKNHTIPKILREFPFEN
jgi:hypothetical protein